MFPDEMVTRSYSDTSMWRAAIMMVVAALAMVACSGRYGAHTSNASGSGEPSANVNARADEPLVLYQVDTNAFGTSSAFTLTVFANGKVAYKPTPVEPMPSYGDDKNKKKEVPVETTVSQEQLQQLLAEFDRANFMSMKDTYATTDDGCPRVVSDQRGVSITFNGKTAQKKVDHYLGCVESGDDISRVYPAELREIENRLDDLVPKQP